MTSLLPQPAAPVTSGASRAAGLALGVLADAVLGDPRRFHPVAGFGRSAAALERVLYADDRARGVAWTAVCVGVPVAAAAGAERVLRGRPVAHAAAVAVATWSVLGGTSLSREGREMAALLEAAGSGDVAALDDGRARLRNLCARDATHLDAEGLARATTESLAENTSDAVVAPLLWGAVAGLPGLVGYRAANTLDAMAGYLSPRYRRFGWACARFDDLVNLVPARVTGALTVLASPAVGGSPVRAWRVLRRDGGRHPSPNAGRPEAAAAGALGVRLGGRNVYPGHVEDRPVLGDGPTPQVPDVRRAVRLQAVVGASAAVVAVGLAAVLGARGARGGVSRPGRGDARAPERPRLDRS